MNTRIAIHHHIEQRFERKVNLSTHWLRLRPAPHTTSRVEAYSLKVGVEPHFLNWVRDPYENHLARLDLPEPVTGLCIRLELLVELSGRNPFDFLVEPSAFSFPFAYSEHLTKELAPYLKKDIPGPRLRAWLDALDVPPGYVIERLGDINLRFYDRLPAFGPSRPGAVDTEKVLAQGGGSPWEIAWLATLTLRHLGLAARFTSGYHIAMAQSEPTQDVARAHAWTEVYLPGAGWIGLDPAAGVFTSEAHIPLASAPEYLRTMPVTGYFEHCRASLEETLTVRRMTPAGESGPYSECQWADIVALGRRVNDELQSRTIDLHLGQSLSFVSAAAEAPEWTTAALGADKSRAAEDLLYRLKARLAPGGIVHLGQGQWMGGEGLPRWRLGLFFRGDGFPVWREASLLGRRQAAFKPTSADACRFAALLAQNLGLASDFVMPAYEDGLHQFWLHRADLNSTPATEDLSDPGKRRALAARLTGDHDEPAGFVLPLRWDPVAEAWSSGVWSFRRGRLVLLPGESALGYRLPLDSLPVGDWATAEPEPERCQFDERPLLPRDFGELNARFTTVTPATESFATADPQYRDTRPPRTALAVQVRHGQVHVFLPPLTHLEHYLSLVAAVEATAKQVGVPVMPEGYEPPEDHRLLRLTLEPDSGCLKLLLPEIAGFAAQSALMEAAYAEAWAAGLRGERRMADGTSLAPGGRAEIRLGGTMPANSPFFRSPELLRSLIVYWQRHPSLSYLFAGRLIGPGGTAPRPDEGRDDALYELAIALERIPSGPCAVPWVPDRLLRHLLADPSGDMRRAEIRIDQLYPPDRSSLRLGRTIVRSFETPPVPRMAALQALLVQGLILVFAREPVRAEPVEWRSALHDRFMLPQVLWEDFLGVLRDLKNADLPFQAEWFLPLVELRFPVLGRVQAGDLELELRTALEPWPVLAEESTPSGTVRFLDVANDKVQVLCRGATPGRHVLVCNGLRVPLRSAERTGELVAGVRFKACELPSTLHPTQPAVDSLVFDLVDAWSGRVLGGCTYIPSQPDPEATIELGRNVGFSREAAPYPSGAAPVRGAPGRLEGTFLPSGSGLQHLEPPPAVMDEHHPYVLDLVRC